jgi:protein-S-isoprenylcysteine O-methyltransferase Ste14
MPQSEQIQPVPDVWVRAGGWLFRRRTSLPLPLVLVLLWLPFDPKGRSAAFAGMALIAFGEALRLWGVHHIGAISRTRSDRLGPLVTTGPFAWIRNPLYVGNLALWIGFALAAHIVWMAPVVLVLLGLEYHAIVRWEEALLEERRGEEYRRYAAEVPRWLPFLHARPLDQQPRVEPAFSWRETIYSERGTIIAIASGFLLLWIKARF